MFYLCPLCPQINVLNLCCWQILPMQFPHSPYYSFSGRLFFYLSVYKAQLKHLRTFHFNCVFWSESFLHQNKIKQNKRKQANKQERSMKKLGRDEMQFNMYKNMFQIHNNLVTLGDFVCIWKWDRYMSRSCHKR